MITLTLKISQQGGHFYRKAMVEGLQNDHHRFLPSLYKHTAPPIKGGF